MPAEKTIEELKTRLEHTADKKEQADILLKLAYELRNHDSEKSTAYGKRALELSMLLNLKEETAKANVLTGTSLSNLGKYEEALRYLSRGLELSQQLGDRAYTALAFNNIALVHSALGNYPESLKNNLSALQIRLKMNNKVTAGFSYNNIGEVLRLQGNFPEALKNYALALQIAEELNDREGIAYCYNNIGLVHKQQGNYPEALKNLSAALKMADELGNQQCKAYAYNNLGTLYSVQGNYPEALKNNLLSLEIKKETGDQWGIASGQLNIADIYLHQGKYPEALENAQLAFQMGEETGNKEIIRNSANGFSNIYKATGDFENALKYYEKYHHADSEMLGEQAQKQLTDLNFTHNMEQKEKEMEIAHLRNVELKNERDRSETLLLNILPSEVAEELKEKGTAEAKLFDEVTVLFTDFKGFTTISERLTPQELVNELHSCFKAFDEIIGKYNIEKIKTVGDAYIAASGLPVPNPNHALDMAKAALEIRDFMLNRRKELGNNTFEMRIGLNSGKVVAGIVGVKKFAYDIWGDTVNTSARMEQSGEAGKINISETTYELVKDKFKCEYRGEIEAKNKGKLKMWFLVRD